MRKLDSDTMIDFLLAPYEGDKEYAEQEARLEALTDTQCHTEYEIENTGYHAHSCNGNIPVDCRLCIQHHGGHAGQSLSHHTGEACCKNVLMYGKFPCKIFRCQAALGLST